MSENINVLDPQVWGKLPIKLRNSVNTELQNVLVIESLKNDPHGPLLVKRRAEGKDLSKEVLLLEHKLEKTVDAKTRRAMGDADWRLRLWPVGSRAKLPPGAGKPFAAKFKIAKTTPLPAGADMPCMICAGGEAYLLALSLDAYLAAIAPPPVDEPVALPAPTEAPTEPETFEGIVALIAAVEPKFDWADWLHQRVVDGATTLDGGIFDVIRPRVAAYIVAAHAEYLAAQTASKTE